MSMVLDGKKVRVRIEAELARTVKKQGLTPTLAIIQLGGREDSSAYIRQKKKAAERIGAQVLHLEFGEGMPEKKLISTIAGLNRDKGIHGIIVQLPLPKRFDEGRIIDCIDPAKDVDGLTARNLKLLLENKPGGFMPATARGILSLLAAYDVHVPGTRVCVVGRSFSVGKPIALSFLNRNATVTIAHSHTRNLAALIQAADIVVVAIGKKRFIGADELRAGQVVVDVGISSSEGEENALIGDVDFESVKEIVAAITPVPGGVGPMTVASLFQNLVEAAERAERP